MPNFEETPEVNPQHFVGVNDPVWNENSSGHAEEIQECCCRDRDVWNTRVEALQGGNLQTPQGGQTVFIFMK